MKLRIGNIFTIIFISLLLTSCNENNNLTILVPSDAYVEYLNEMITKLDINYTINYISLSKELPEDYENNPEKYIIQNANQADLIIGIPYSQYPIISSSNTFLNVKPYLENEKLSVYQPVLDGLTVKEEIKAIPLGFYNSFLLINEDLSSLFNIETKNYSWQEIKAISENIYSKSQGSIKGIATGNNVKNELPSIFNTVTYPIEGSLYELNSENRLQINETKINKFIEIFEEGFKEGFMNATFEDFFTGKSLFAFVNIYDMDYYFNHFENKTNFKYAILKAPNFDGTSGSYIIPGDLIAINKNTKNSKASTSLLKEMLLNYGDFYDSGSFGWFSLVNQKVQAKIVNQFKIDKELIYNKDDYLTPATPVYYSFTELMNLNQKFYNCSKNGFDVSINKCMN